ncbi:hypothetical protein AB0J81_36015 [Streptomyces bobili]|uniref:hypothetical protein n=1 Tax=Streptomyces bobili TaxID=67280 RepID=UPI003429CE55
MGWTAFVLALLGALVLIPAAIRRDESWIAAGACLFIAGLMVSAVIHGTERDYWRWSADFFFIAAMGGVTIRYLRRLRSEETE